MGGYGPSERAVAVDPLWVAAPGMSFNGFAGHAGRARAQQPMRRRSRHGVWTTGPFACWIRGGVRGEGEAAEREEAAGEASRE